MGVNNSQDLNGKKFIASYSGGKDSVLALYKAIKSGLSPLGLITTYNTDEKRSWFHGITENIIQKVSDSLEIPITLIKTSGEKYEENFEAALSEAKEKGAEVCVFGDIDIEGHLKWCSSRCEKTGLTAYFPLWQEPRKKVVHEFIDSGFFSLITIIDSARLPKRFLGQVLTKETADAIEESGADICGENGEYHTFVFDGPIFKNKIELSAGEKFERDHYCILPIE
jgi:uncharacterized protein (TIGR00290 family)